MKTLPVPCRRVVTLCSLVAFSILPAGAAEVAVLPDTPTEVLTATGAHPTYNNRNDGLGTTSDLLDMTFTFSIDFLEKLSGEREVIWETGAGTVGTSVVYEAPNTIVARSTGNGGFSLVTTSYALSAGEVATGPLLIGWTYDVSNPNGTQTLSLIVNGQIVASNEENVGGDWSGSDPARIGTGGGITGTGANGTIPGVAFTSGTLDLVTGLAFYADTLWLPVPDDTDADGLPDAWEEIYFPGDLTALASGSDNDADGLADEEEFANGSDPTDTDTDGDGLTDGREANPLAAGYTATDLLNQDTDGDGRSDGDEVDGALMSDALERDTDGDRFIDGVEVDAGTDPNSPDSTPAIGGFLAAYYPLDSLDAGGVSAPDLAGARLDLEARNLSSGSVVPGRIGNAVSFDGTAESILCRDSAPDEDLPIAQHQDYTVSMWVNVDGSSQNVRRVFSEGLRTSDNPLLALGTDTGGANTRLEVLARNNGDSNGTEQSVGTPLDGTWHHIAWVRFGASYELYIDGVLDTQNFTFVDPFVDGLTTTAIGGTHRLLQSNWVTGLIDDVSLWKVALPAAQIAELATGMAAGELVEDLDMDGMPDAWEELNGLDPGNAADAAANGDADMLTNLEEYQRGTDPNAADTDGDGLLDHVETNSGIWVSSTDTGTSPRNADTDADGLLDGVENPDLAYDPDDAANQPGTDPNDPDTDDDTVGDGAEVAGGSDPTSSGSVPEPEAYFSWCPDDEPLGSDYGADGVFGATGAMPPPAGLEPQGTINVVAISDRGAAQTEFTQAVDFDGAANSYFTITPEPNALRDMIGAQGVQSEGTLELFISPDSLGGPNQYVWESGGTGDGHGIVLIGSMLHFGVNSGNGAPVGNAVATVDLAPLYGASFSADDYLLVRATAIPESQIILGVTHLGNGNSASSSEPWTGNSWDGGDPLGKGRLQGGRGGDRNNQLSNQPGASTSWSSFDGQLAKFSVYPGVLASTINVNTEVFRITKLEISEDDMITIEWASFPDETYSVFSSNDLINFQFEIADSLPATGARTSFTFPNQQPGAPRIYFRVVKQ